ncbi:hypothetical protein QTH87_22050 [Variovorax sp. J22P168]|uniref:hypothetical protein n=1 Tax=Variovorax jilinensis TaxID=3053513 RepID=UPI0025761C42|nr:hypothetical protein [Variovorax sp. J22P168]MDM0015143.1 hypothetical protein [Variovorax sp. J22P168]
MSDHTVIGLRAAIKALKDVVTPAVDTSNPLAVEQLRMVCGFLSMVCDRLPYRSERIRFELRSAVELAQALMPCTRACDRDAVSALERSLACGVGFIKEPDATETDIQAATARLTAATSALVRSSADIDEATRRRIDRAVAVNAKAWLDVQRAWFLPLGFDTESNRLPSIAAALALSTPTEKAPA